MFWKGFLLLFCTLVVAAITLSFIGRPGKLEPAPDAHALFEANKVLFTAIGTADRLTLYEGLPHQMNESELLERERREKSTVEFHGFPFYRQPLDVAPDDAAQLKGIMGDVNSFVPWFGQRKCGGFHPDYLAEWQVGGSSYQVLLCFGCNEVQIFGSDRSLLCDMAVKQKLQLLLKKYRKNRPPGKDE